MAKILYWTGAGIGNLIQATPAFFEIVKNGHDLTVYPEDVPHGTLECIYPYSFNGRARFISSRPFDLSMKGFDFIIYSEFRGLKNPPEGKNVFKPKMNWWKESESYYHMRSSCAILGMNFPASYNFHVRPTDLCIEESKSEIKKSVMLCPAGKGGQRIKRWPYFPVLAKRLKDMGWNVFVTGDPEELKHPKDWGGCEICVGMSLMEVGKVIKKVSIVIANESGLMHYANALGKPTYAIVGPTSIIKNVPSGVNIIKNNHCSLQPCQEKFTDWMFSDKNKNSDLICRRECLTFLDVDHVLKNVKEIEWQK